MLSGYTEDDYGNIVTALSEALHTKEPSLSLIHIWNGLPARPAESHDQ